LPEFEILNSLIYNNVVSLVTKTIDVFVLTIISLSTIQALTSMIVYKIKELMFGLTDRRQEIPKESNVANKKDATFLKMRNLINSLLLALELESANAILKMGLFASIVTDTDNSFSANGLNNFIFFMALLSLRIAINQTIRKFWVRKRI
jgi:hypothetical protein